jgi:hypothetical protein
VYIAVGHGMLAFVLFAFKLRKQVKINGRLSYLKGKIVHQIILVNNIQTYPINHVIMLESLLEIRSY